MELKHHNPNGEIILTDKFTPIKKKLWKIMKITFKKEFYKLFIQEDA